MSPIKGLTDRGASFPRIGILRKGAPRPKDGKRPGKDLDHFRFDPGDDTELADHFRDAYGNEPRAINIILAFQDMDRNFEAWKEAWVQGGLVHRCDGETCVLLRTKEGAFSQEPLPCPGGCSVIGRLKVIIPELRRFGYVEVQTGSINDVVALQENLEAIYSLRGDLRGIPMTLSRTLRNISTPGKDGKRLRRDVWLVSIEPQRQWVEAQIASMERAALPEPARPLLIDGKTGEILEGLDTEPESDTETDVVVEAEVEVVEGNGVEPSPAPTIDDLKTLPRPWPADVVVMALQHQAVVAEKEDRQPDEGTVGACIGIMDKAGERDLFTLAVFGHSSTKDLTPFQRRALTDWINPSPDEEGPVEPGKKPEWIPAKPSVFQQEFNAVVEARLAEEGQEPLPDGETQEERSPEEWDAEKEGAFSE